MVKRSAPVGRKGQSPLGPTESHDPAMPMGNKLDFVEKIENNIPHLNYEKLLQNLSIYLGNYMYSLILLCLP